MAAQTARHKRPSKSVVAAGLHGHVQVVTVTMAAMLVVVLAFVIYGLPALRGATRADAWLRRSISPDDQRPRLTPSAGADQRLAAGSASAPAA
jgi:hypothetical protein